MTEVTDSYKTAIKNWIDANVVAGGGTNFKSGFEEAFNLLGQANLRGCNKAILFMSDGVPNSWTASDDTWLSNKVSTNVAGHPSIFTYALGSGADPTVLKRVACRHKGIFHTVNDGGNLA